MNETKQIPNKPKVGRRRGALANSSRVVRLVTALVLAVTCAALAFTQLGFAGLGFSGEYEAYIVVLLLPIALAALLLGVFASTLIGLFAGTMLLVHSIVMPLDFYEYTFVTPLTSVVMLGVCGLLLGLLFWFALRNDPPPVKSAIYIIIVCFIVSWLYSVGFFVNIFVSLFMDAMSSTAEYSDAQIVELAQVRVAAIATRMGNLSLQTVIDGILMSVACIIANNVAAKAKSALGAWGLRGVFAIRMLIVVFVAFMVTSAVAFASVTLGEVAAATEDLEDEVSYLCNQLDLSDQRSDAFGKIMDKAGVDISALSDEQFLEIVNTTSIGTLLDGYSREADGTILILLPSSEAGKEDAIDDGDAYTIIDSDDERFKQDDDLAKAAGKEIVWAIEASAKTQSVQRAVFDENHDDISVMFLEDRDAVVRSHIVYLYARASKGFLVAMMLPASKVFAGRVGVMGWTSLSALVLLVAVFGMVFLLLDRMIVRRIDETNGVLSRITGGDLDAKVQVNDPREFASLSAGVNETVGALKGWIAEAETRMDAELATAKAIQESALPRVFPPYPDIRHFDVYASMQAAKEVGGDFYDFFLIGDDCDADSGKLGFIIADVSGKGVPAALFMMKAVTQLRDYLKSGMEIGEAVENANRQLCEGNDKGMFLTAWVGVLDYATGHVDYVNAGHNPPLLWSQGGRDEDGNRQESGWRWLTDKSGMPLGLFDLLPYTAYSVECRVGDQFLLYTDGVTEAMSVEGELYGEDRLEKLVNEGFVLHPRMLVESVRSSVAQWASGAEQSDDITMLSLEVGVPPEVTATLKVPANVNELTNVNEFIHGELDRRLCPKRVQSQLDIAVEELFVNVCHYAYPDATPESPGTILVQRTYSAEPPSIMVGIVDEGVAFDPLAKPDAVTPDNIEDVPIGGLGILMVKKCVNEISYERVGDTNVVTIVKKW